MCNLELLKNYQWMYNKYVVQRLDTVDIANILRTYKERVRLALTKLGIPRRNTFEKQQLNVKKGKIKPPTKGRHRTEKEKYNIALGTMIGCTNMSDEAKAAKREFCRKRWNNFTQEYKLHIRKLASQGLNKTTRNGSKIEKFLRQNLLKSGNIVEYHVVYDFDDKNYKIDIVLPEFLLAIDIVSPQFLNKKPPIDNTYILMKNGFNIVRLMMHKHVSNIRMQLTLKYIQELMHNIENGEVSNQLFIKEV